jgi:hypothetical protein
MDPNRPLHEWTDKQLADRLRSYPTGNDPTHGWNLKAEIERRRNIKIMRYTLAGVIAAAVAAVGSMLAAIASLVAVYYSTHPPAH